MNLELFVRGTLIGLSIAAPVGPIGVLCIRRTLTDGRIVGLATGLGAATADAAYGAIAAFGLTAISTALVAHAQWIRLGGGVFLLYLGLKTLRAIPATRAAATAGHGTLAAYASAVALTMTNPATILSFAAIFAGLGAVVMVRQASAAAVLVLGVFTGSTLWWIILSSGVGLLKKRITPRLLRGINILSGSILLAFGLLAWATLL